MDHKIETLLRNAWNSGMGSYHDTKTSKQLDVELEDFIDSVKDEFNNIVLADVSERVWKADEIIKHLEDCDHLDDAKMYFDEHGR